MGIGILTGSLPDLSPRKEHCVLKGNPKAKRTKRIYGATENTTTTPLQKRGAQKADAFIAKEGTDTAVREMLSDL